MDIITLDGATPEDRVRQLKDTIAQIQAARARAGIELDAAVATVEKCRAELKVEFGVETTEEAKAVLSALEFDRDAAIGRAEASLERSTTT